MQKKLSPPRPLIGKDKPVDWLLVYKFNAANFPGCTDDGTTPKVGSTGIFGGTVEAYKSGHSQQYVYASSVNPELVKGEGCVGATYTDPLGATFAQVYDTPGYYYVLWNDQFYNNPIKTGKEHTGHSKGMLAWNEDGEGMVMQVSTPSWPASGSKAHPRQNDGNTLGCINDDDVEVAQHFFAFSINKDDLVAILTGINNASVVTSTAHPEIVQNGGPAEVQTLVNELGKESKGTTVIKSRLSNGIQLISKPSRLAVPPWQMVSAELGGIPLRVASWWAEPFIYSTSADTPIACWPESLAKPGPVAIATTGNWQGTTLGLTGGEGTNHNHAKIGVSMDSQYPLCIFGDMNQQGALGPDYAYKGQTCSSSQNGRGGLFYVVENVSLFKTCTALLQGDTAPETGPNGE